MDSDGNCLFRSLSDQLYHDFGNRYEEVRHDVCDFLQANENDFKGFLLLEDEDEDEAKGGGSSKATSACSVDEDAVADFNAYVAKMRQDGEWGGHLELQAASRMYRRNINVFSANMVSYTIEHGSGKRSAGPDLHVSFHGNEHYNSVRLNSASKPPPPPLKTFDKKATSSLVDKMEDEREAMEVADDMEEDTTDDKSVDPDESTSEAPRMLDAGEEDSEGYPKTNSRPKNNSPCTCGSGVRYKKCCKEKDKHTARLNRMGLTIQGSLDAEEETFGTCKSRHNGEKGRAIALGPTGHYLWEGGTPAACVVRILSQENLISALRDSKPSSRVDTNHV
jgi:hypothetical protein